MAILEEQNMKRNIIFKIAFLLLSIASFGQNNSENVIYIVDKITILEDPTWILTNFKMKQTCIYNGILNLIKDDADKQSNDCWILTQDIMKKFQTATRWEALVWKDTKEWSWSSEG